MQQKGRGDGGPVSKGRVLVMAVLVAPVPAVGQARPRASPGGRELRGLCFAVVSLTWDGLDSFLGFSFDLSPLTKKNGAYKVETEKYEFYINVCGAVSVGSCQPDSGACQMSKRQVTVPSSRSFVRYLVLTGVLFWSRCVVC